MAKNKAILLIHYNPDSTGSAVYRMRCLARMLAKEHTVYFCLPRPGNLSEALADEPIEFVFRGMHENNGVFQYVFHFTSFLSWLIRKRIGMILVLDYVWWKPAELLAAWFSRIPSVAIVAYYRGEAAEKGFIRLVDRIVPNSEHTAEEFYRAGLRDKTTVIHNFIEPLHYSEAKDIRSELQPQEGPLLGYVGVLHPVKGIPYLLGALAELKLRFPSLRLILAGHEKEPGYRAELDELCSDLGVTDSVQFLGHREDIPSLMKSIDILVVPSLEEPFGFVNIEAGAAGTAVVASRVGGIPEIIADGTHGLLVTPKDVEALVAAIEQLLSQPERRSKLAEALQGRVLQEFSTEKALEKWQTLFNEMSA